MTPSERSAKLRESNNILQQVKVEMIKSTMLQVFLGMLTKHLPPNDPTVHTEKAKQDFMKFVDMEGIEFTDQMVNLVTSSRKKQLKATIALLLQNLQTIQIQILGMENVTAINGTWANDHLILKSINVKDIKTEVAMLSYVDLIEQLKFIKKADPIKLIQNIISGTIETSEVAMLFTEINALKSSFKKTTLLTNGYDANDVVASLLNSDNYQGIVNYLNSFINLSVEDIDLLTEAVEKTIESSSSNNGYEHLNPFTQSIEVVVMCSSLIIDVLFTRMLIADTILNCKK